MLIVLPTHTIASIALHGTKATTPRLSRIPNRTLILFDARLQKYGIMQQF